MEKRRRPPKKRRPPRHSKHTTSAALTVIQRLAQERSLKKISAPCGECCISPTFTRQGQFFGRGLTTPPKSASLDLEIGQNPHKKGRDCPKFARKPRFWGYDPHFAEFHPTPILKIFLKLASTEAFLIYATLSCGCKPLPEYKTPPFGDGYSRRGWSEF